VNGPTREIEIVEEIGQYLGERVCPGLFEQ
jgi:hypothetical protein